MAGVLSGYEMLTFSNLIFFIALATILHLQFGRAGIVNFGVVGFFGLGMYSFGVFLIQYSIPFLPAMIMAVALTGAAAWILGRIILDLDSQSVLVATLAFATIIADLAVTEKKITRGVIGLGTVPFPIDAGLYSQFLLFLVVLASTALLIIYVFKMESSPYGRLLSGIHDNEPLAKGLGKPTFREKHVLFTITSALMGFFGALYASSVHFLVPRLLGPETTFVVWIALILGGRKRVLGGLVGVLATIGIFDFVIETYVPIPAAAQSQLLPVVKLLIYGATLVLILTFRPSGILGKKKTFARKSVP